MNRAAPIIEATMDRMTTSQLPAPVTLLPVGDDKNLLTVVESRRIVLRRFRLRHR